MATPQQKEREQRKLNSAHIGIVCAIALDVRSGTYDELIARTVATAALRNLKLELEYRILDELPKFRRSRPESGDERHRDWRT